MSFCTVFKCFFAAYLLSSYKSLPGAYFVRFYYYVTQTLFLPIFTGFETENIKKLEKNEYGCFSYNKLDTYASPFECDFYFHKSNSTYFAELDISRGSLMCKIFQKLMLNSRHYPYVPVANVFTNFLKEIKPFQKYSISSNIICWNEKWIYVMSRFTIKNGTVLCSLSLTKYVLKDGRKTIKPKDALEYCGIYNEKVAKISEDNLKLLTEHCGFHETVPLENLSQDYCSEI